MQKLVLKLIVVLVFCLSFVNSELFSAIEELEKQLSNEKHIIDQLGRFAEKVKDEYINRKLKIWKDEHYMSESNTHKYITNPLNAFLIIKRATSDIKLIVKQFAKDSKEFVENIKLFQPSDIDLRGAVEGLRLQFFYKLKTVDFANGIIDGKETRLPLSAHDLFIIGEEAMKIDGQDYFALEYLKIVWKQVQQGKDADREVDEKNVILHLISIYKRIRSPKKALELLTVLTEKYPQSPQDDYYTLLNYTLRKDLEQFGSKKPTVVNPFSDFFIHDGIFSDSKDRILNSQICRGNVSKPAEETSKLHCRFVSTNSFSKLARFKIEEANLDPYMVVFVDILSDSEIKFLKDASKAKQGPGTITSSNLQQTVSNRRIAQISWHSDNVDEIFRKLSRRVEDMTGLSQLTAKPLQTQNYGIGGHYVGHWDCYMKWDKPFEMNGNRIATMLFYLSDVEKGGGTVFPFLKLHISPRKGAAIFWNNLSSSGTCDFLTRHSACPVLLGSKWVSNKWIREHENEFRKPCATDKIYKAEEMEKFLFKKIY